MSGVEAAVLDTRVRPGVVERQRQHRQIVCRGVQIKSFAIAVNELSVDAQLSDDGVGRTAIPPVDGLRQVSSVAENFYRLADVSSLTDALEILVYKDAWLSTINNIFSLELGAPLDLLLRSDKN